MLCVCVCFLKHTRFFALYQIRAYRFCDLQKNEK